MHIFVSTSALPTLHPFLKAHWSQALHCSAAGSNFHPAKFDHFWGTHSNLVETAILSDTLLTVPDRSYCFMCSVKYVAPHYILSVAWCLTPFIKSAPLETTFNAFQVANTREKVSFVNKKKKKKKQGWKTKENHQKSAVPTWLINYHSILLSCLECDLWDWGMHLLWSSLSLENSRIEKHMPFMLPELKSSLHVEVFAQLVYCRC